MIWWGENMNNNKLIPSIPTATRVHRWLMLALIVAGTSVAASVEAGAGSSVQLANQVEQSLDLRGGDSIALDIPAHSRFLLIQNVGIDSIAELRDQSDHVLASAASWRGMEGRYVLDLRQTLEPAVVVIKTNQHTRNGNVYLQWLDEQSLSEQAVKALALWSRAADLHLQALHGDASRRDSAIVAYKQSAQSIRTTELGNFQADLLYEIAQAQRAAGDLELAQASFIQALAAYQTLKDTSGIAFTYNALGRTARSRGNLAEAERLYQRSLAERQRLSDQDSPHDALYQAITLNNIGIVNLEQDKFDLASTAFSQALPMLAGISGQTVDAVLGMTAAEIGERGDLSETVNTMNNLAVVKAAVGQVGEAALLYERTMQLATETNQAKRVADAHFNIGRLLLDLGQLDASLRHLDSAAAIFADLQNDFWYGQTLEWIANIYNAVGEHATAEEYLTRALSLSGENQRQRANVLGRLGQVDYQQGALASADYYFSQSYASFAGSGQPGSAAVVASKHALVSMAQGDTDAALHKQRQAIDALAKLGQPRELARARSRLGQSLLEMGDAAAAERELTAALAGHRAVDDQLFELDTLVALSSARAGQAALDTIQDAATLAASIRLNTRAPQLQTSFMASRRNAFGRYIDLLVASDRGEEAWAVSEHIRARSLLDLITADDSIISSDAALRERRDAMMESLANNDDSMGKRQLRRQIDLLESRMRDGITLDEMVEFRPQAKSLQAALAADVLMISYFLGVDHSHLWLVSADEIQHVNLPSGTEITANVHALSDALRSHRQSPSRIEFMAASLRDQILPLDPSVISGKELVIVADGALQMVPFELLPLADNTLLMDQTTVIYTPSARLFAMLDNKFTISPSSIAVLADPMADHSKLLAMHEQPGIGASRLFAQRALNQSAINVDRLPGAHYEAKAIQQKVTADSSAEHAINRVSMVTGSAASRDYVTTGGLQGYGILHFATHGVIDADIPELSGLVVSGDQTNGDNISYLRPHDIAQLQLDADLVVLSGCETGIGKSLAGEGLMSLTRPFFVAGARQVVSSLWKVSDQATAALMEHFYTHLLDDSLPAEKALQMAKDDMRADPQWQHPYFWAGFVIQGGRAQQTKDAVALEQVAETSTAYRNSSFGAVLMGTSSP